MIKGEINLIWAKRTILASGGAGQLYRESTNPKIATADGHAMAYRAGATLQDMEMVQFHPTTLYVAGASRALITEAVRGEGAYLVDRNGYRFMTGLSRAGELAARDVVSRAIVEQIRKTQFHACLSRCSASAGRAVHERFPQLAKLLDQFDIDPRERSDPDPSRGPLHDRRRRCRSHGQTSLPGLYAVGEASCTGLHGANRLASNSLLEGLAFGARAGADAARHAAGRRRCEFPHQLEHHIASSTKTELDITDVKSSLRSVMWRNVGIERTGDRLDETREIIAFWSRYVMDKTFDPGRHGRRTPFAGWELQNMLTACSLITTAAYTRTESRGAHYRLDYPEPRRRALAAASALAAADGNADSSPDRSFGAKPDDLIERCDAFRTMHIRGRLNFPAIQPDSRECRQPSPRPHRAKDCHPQKSLPMDRRPVFPGPSGKSAGPAS